MAGIKKASKKRLADCVLYSDGRHHLVRIEKEYYLIDKFMGSEGVVASIERVKGKLICCRARDFGGCGKDAMKPEKNVPVGVWLSECYAVAIDPVSPEVFEQLRAAGSRDKEST